MEAKKNCKIVIFGESNVGKTCFSNRIIYNHYEDNLNSTSSPSQSTITRELEGKTICFDIWDTPGQEHYRSLNKLYYKGVDIAILLYSINDKSSFEEIEQYWFFEIKEHCKSNPSKKLKLIFWCIVFAIVGTKDDLFIDNEVGEKAKEFAKKNHCFFALTSAKLNTGIEELFYELAIAYQKKQKGLPYIQGQTEIEEDNERKDGIQLSSSKFKKKNKSQCCGQKDKKQWILK